MTPEDILVEVKKHNEQTMTQLYQTANGDGAEKQSLVDIASLVWELLQEDKIEAFYRIEEGPFAVYHEDFKKIPDDVSWEQIDVVFRMKPAQEKKEFPEHPTYDDLDAELLEALQAVAGGCGQWISGDPRLMKLHRIDENLLWWREGVGNDHDVHLGPSGRAYLAGLKRGSRR